MDLPYKAEYAKSSRASCRGCKSGIAKGTLRLAVMVQSPMFDGKTPNWYHQTCFFKKQRPKTVDDFENYGTLRYEDQETIKKEIDSTTSVIVPKGKGKKRAAGNDTTTNKGLKDFLIEYAKSARATCVGCQQKIMKDDVRVSKKDFDSEIGRKYGGQDRWHHLHCFAQLRCDLGYYASADLLPGFKNLSKDDQKEASKQIPAIKQEDVPDAPEMKKIKQENKEEEKTIKEQNKIFYNYRDQLALLNKCDLQLLLTENDQEVPPGKDTILDRLADVMTFGRLLPCDICEGQFEYKTGGYMCSGNATEWTKCENLTKEPKRAKFVVPSSLKTQDFLIKYKYVARKRYIKDVNPTSVKKEKDDPDGQLPKIIRDAPPLLNMQFVILGKPTRGKDELKKQILKLGGKVITKISKDVMAVFATKEDVEKMGSRMMDVKEQDVHVVPEEFVDEASKYNGRIPELIKEKTISDWGSDPYKRLPPEPSVSKSKSGSYYTKSVPKKITMKLKSGGAVDPDSGLENQAVIYQEGDDKYNAILGLTDIQKQKNSFYKLQLLQSESSDKFWLFRSWGRIGTIIGDNRLNKMSTLLEAKNEFERLYEEKTGNMWCDRHDFQKRPGRMYPIDVDYGEDDTDLELNEQIPSNLPKPVQNLVKMIFDVKAMKNTMLEFELDTEKMPLGRLSRKQVESAFSVLKEIQMLITDKGEKHKFIDASNRFYTFIPHSFGIDTAPVIETEDVIKLKTDMLNNLLELEIAYNILKSNGKNTGIDDHYNKLNTEITVIDENTTEYDIVKQYVKNTHAETHDMYELELTQLFAVNRQGEEKRFKPFKKLHNRKLLWHGSRLTNFAGILSQGLRIAPPEAPVTGYMFGKGIYFADMVSKSANYCCADSVNSTGLMLLCEVALGNMHECKKSSYIEKLPKNKHSCKGVGMTHPNPELVEKLEDVEVPIGKPVSNKNLKSDLLYNEYIVYDIAQVKTKYLCQMNFKYKY